MINIPNDKESLFCKIHGLETKEVSDDPSYFNSNIVGRIKKNEMVSEF